MNALADPIVAAEAADMADPELGAEFPDQLRHNNGTANKHYGLPCPHCGSPGRIRTSDLIEPTFRVIYFECSYYLCGHKWRASLAYEYGIQPSAIPKPGVDLPLKTPNRADLIDDSRRALPGPEPGPLPLFD